MWTAFYRFLTIDSRSWKYESAWRYMFLHIVCNLKTLGPHPCRWHWLGVLPAHSLTMWSFACSSIKKGVVDCSTDQLLLYIYICFLCFDVFLFPLEPVFLSSLLQWSSVCAVHTCTYIWLVFSSSSLHCKLSLTQCLCWRWLVMKTSEVHVASYRGVFKIMINIKSVPVHVQS